MSGSFGVLVVVVVGDFVVVLDRTRIIWLTKMLREKRVIKPNELTALISAENVTKLKDVLS